MRLAQPGGALRLGSRLRLSLSPRFWSRSSGRAVGGARRGEVARVEGGGGWSRGGAGGVAQRMPPTLLPASPGASRTRARVQEESAQRGRIAGCPGAVGSSRVQRLRRCGGLDNDGRPIPHLGAGEDLLLDSLGDVVVRVPSILVACDDAGQESPLASWVELEREVRREPCSRRSEIWWRFPTRAGPPQDGDDVAGTVGSAPVVGPRWRHA